jgi:NAD(P)-dependent dehydrogenase (short-subunit alcohol dehydrogenase family)
MLLAGQVALVTGAGRGIGRAIARRFAAEGAAVVLAARTAAEIDDAAAEITRARGQAATVAADVSREADCERVVRAARERFGAIHILVNNAGAFGPVKLVHEITPAEFDAVLAVNLRSAFLLMRLALPEMCARGSGSIVNISSVAAKNAWAYNGAYGTAKAGLLALTRVAAGETARRGVRVNAICPGPVTETRMSKELGEQFSALMSISKEEQLERLFAGILQGRATSAEEVAAAALFLVSPQAAAITGQALNVDGGINFY